MNRVSSLEYQISNQKIRKPNKRKAIYLRLNENDTKIQIKAEMDSAGHTAIGWF